jgi:NRPS condensation-like uncharacterized protein
MVEQDRPEEELVKATFLLRKKDIEDLQALARAEGTSVNDVLARAIATFKFFKDVEYEGNKVLLQGPGRKFELVRLP